MMQYCILAAMDAQTHPTVNIFAWFSPLSSILPFNEGNCLYIVLLHVSKPY
jgi:hypothetical protein